MIWDWKIGKTYLSSEKLNTNGKDLFIVITKCLKIDIPDICHGPMGQAPGEKICHVEKFQISVNETCGES